MVSVLVSSAVDRGLESRLSQTKDYKIGICCFSTKNVALRSKSKDWLARNQNNMSEWSNMSVRWHYENPTQHLEQSGPHHHHHLIKNLLVLAMISLKNC